MNKEDLEKASKDYITIFGFKDDAKGRKLRQMCQDCFIDGVKWAILQAYKDKTLNDNII
jgi:hypothetical protein